MKPYGNATRSRTAQSTTSWRRASLTTVLLATALPSALFSTGCGTAPPTVEPVVAVEPTAIEIPDKLTRIPARPQPPDDFTAESVASFVLDRGDAHVKKLEAQIRGLLDLIARHNDQ